MNLTKKLLQLLLCAALIFGLCSTVALAETPTVTLSSPEGALKVGDTFTVNVDMANNTGFAAVQWRLEYNSSALELTDILTETDDSTFIFGTMACETATEYRKATDALNLNISASTGKNNTKNGTLCQLVFKVKDGAQDGIYDISIDTAMDDFMFVDIEKNPLNATFVSAQAIVGADDLKLYVRSGEEGAYTYNEITEDFYLNTSSSETAPWKDTATLVAMKSGKPAASAVWTIENTDVVSKTDTEAETGMINLKATGSTPGSSTTVTATADGVSVSCTVKVADYAASISKVNLNLPYGAVSYAPDKDFYVVRQKEVVTPTYELVNAKGEAIADASNAGTITWTIDENPRYASYSNGSITFNGSGTAYVVVKAHPSIVGTVDGKPVTIDGEKVAFYTGMHAQPALQLQKNSSTPIERTYKAEDGTMYPEVTVRTNGTATYFAWATVEDTYASDSYITIKSVEPLNEADASKLTIQSRTYGSGTDKRSQLLLTGLEVTDEPICLVVKFWQTFGQAYQYERVYVNVTGPVYPETISLNKTSTTLDQFALEKLTATLEPADNDFKTIEWSSSSEDIATVDSDGNVTALKPGKTVITATATSANGKISADCVVTVNAIDVSKVYLAVGHGKGEFHDLTNRDMLYVSTNRSGGVKGFSWDAYEDLCVMYDGKPLSAVKWSLETEGKIISIRTPGNIAIKADEYHDVIRLFPQGEKTTGTVTATLPDGTALVQPFTVKPWPTATDIGFKTSESNNVLRAVGTAGTPSLLGEPGSTVKFELNSWDYLLALDHKIVIADPEIASIDENGVVTFLKDGTTELYITFNGPVDGDMIDQTYPSKVPIYSGKKYARSVWFTNADGSEITDTYTFMNKEYPMIKLKAGGEPVVLKLAANCDEALQNLTIKKFSVYGVNVEIDNDAKTLKLTGYRHTYSDAPEYGFASYTAADCPITFTTTKLYVDVDYADATSIDITLPEGDQKTGQDIRLSSVITPYNASTDIVWTSDDPDMVVVDSYYSDNSEKVFTKLRFSKPGLKTITATLGDYSTTVQLNVLESFPVLTASIEKDQRAAKGDTVSVDVNIKGDYSSLKYNAYEVMLNYDPAKLEYVDATIANEDANRAVTKVEDGKLAIYGYGDSITASEKSLLATLNFKVLEAGTADVTIASAKANDNRTAWTQDLKDIAISSASGSVTINAVNVITVDFVNGTVNGGKTQLTTETDSITFTVDAVEGKNVESVMVNGAALTANENGEYTLSGLTGDTTVTINYVDKIYSVKFSGNGAEDATGADKVTHGQTYSFDLNEKAGYSYTVKIKVGGNEIDVSGTTIPGKYVTGDIEIEITRKSISVGSYAVQVWRNNKISADEETTVSKDASEYTFTYDPANWKLVKVTVNGTEVTVTDNNGTVTVPGTFNGNIAIYYAGIYSVTLPEKGAKGDSSVTYGEDYKFTVDDGYTLGTVTIGGVEYQPTLNEDGSYTIKGEDITGEIVITVIEPNYGVEVYEYVKLRTAQSVMLVVVKTDLPEGKTLNYAGYPVFYSAKYEGYAYLTIIGANESLTPEDAAKNLSQVNGTTTEVAYTGDANMSGVVDMNDAQLVYDMYNATFTSLNGSGLTMEHFLRADMNADHKLDSFDARVIADSVYTKN